MIQTGIIETLRKPGSYTLFVPGSDAFARVLEEAGLTEEEFLQLESLEKILGYHVAIGTPDILEYKAEREIETLVGPTLKLYATDTEHASVNDISLTSVLNDTTLNTNGEYELSTVCYCPQAFHWRSVRSTSVKGAGCLSQLPFFTKVYVSQSSLLARYVACELSASINGLGQLELPIYPDRAEL